MNYSGWNIEQKEALVDLLMLGMYADGHLALTEDDHLQQLLDRVQPVDAYAREQMADRSLRRVVKHTVDPQKRQRYIGEIAKLFNDRTSKNQVMATLNELSHAGGQERPKETEFLRVVREALQ